MTLSFSKYNDYLDMPINEFDQFDNYVPREVCHYTSMETALEKILRDQRIRLGEITSTNDPKESKERFYFDVDWKNFGKTGADSLESEAEYYIRKEWRVLCTTCHDNPSWNFINFYEDEPYHKDHHVFGMSHSRMWAQYARNHSGTCLLFDGRILDKSINETLKRDVT